MRIVIYSLVGLLGCANASNPAVDREAEVRAIGALNQQWSEAAKDKDVERILSFYAPDATAAFPDKPPAVGIAALRTLWQQDLAIPGLVTLSWVPEKIEVSAAGDMASDFGRVHSEWQTPDGVVKSTDKYLAVWKKVNGVWKVSYDMWNTNAPLK